MEGTLDTRFAQEARAGKARMVKRLRSADSPAAP
jgi:hypothetical protein